MVNKNADVSFNCDYSKEEYADEVYKGKVNYQIVAQNPYTRPKKQSTDSFVENEIIVRGSDKSNDSNLNRGQKYRKKSGLENISDKSSLLDQKELTFKNLKSQISTQNFEKLDIKIPDSITHNYPQYENITKDIAYNNKPLKIQLENLAQKYENKLKILSGENKALQQKLLDTKANIVPKEVYDDLYFKLKKKELELQEGQLILERYDEELDGLKMLYNKLVDISVDSVKRMTVFNKDDRVCADGQR